MAFWEGCRTSTVNPTKSRVVSMERDPPCWGHPWRLDGLGLTPIGGLVVWGNVRADPAQAATVASARRGGNGCRRKSSHGRALCSVFVARSQLTVLRLEFHRIAGCETPIPFAARVSAPSRSPKSSDCETSMTSLLRVSPLRQACLIGLAQNALPRPSIGDRVCAKPQ